MTTSARSLLALGLLVLATSAVSQWWAATSQQQLGREVAALARAGDIGMLASDTCAICVQARLWMQAQGVPFSECSIERDAACMAAYRASAAPGTPVLLVRGQPLVGFSPARLRQALADARPPS